MSIPIITAHAVGAVAIDETCRLYPPPRTGGFGVCVSDLSGVWVGNFPAFGPGLHLRIRKRLPPAGTTHVNTFELWTKTTDLLGIGSGFDSFFHTDWART